MNVATVKRYAPDLIGLQELRAESLATYREKLPGYAYILGPGAGNGSRWHQYWTADVRYIEDHKLGGGTVYVISILNNYSRAILASSVSHAEDQSAFLRVLHRAVKSTAPRRASSPTAAGSSARGGRSQSTRLWASARRRSRGAGRGNRT